MKEITFQLNKNLSNEFKQYKINKGIDLFRFFTIKSDYLESSFIYQYDTHDSLKDTTRDIQKMLNYFNCVYKPNFNVVKSIKQHTIILNDRFKGEYLIEQKKNKNI